ncbi:MAG: hypothetical protein IPP91_11130 [Betaproteobacteria bacterium]|nr:hypothetical protein [Betaproteobacteria bacterium]
MSPRIRGLNRGRLRVWWITHRQDAIRAAQLVALVGCFLAVSAFDCQDQLDMERAAREDAQAQLAAERSARALPRLTFVIDARTPAEAQVRLAEIASDADVQRLNLRGRK